MLSFGVIGVSIRGGNVDLLEAMAIPEQDRLARLHEVKDICRFEELISVQTCNRAEFYFIGAPDVSTIDARNRLLDCFLKKTDRVSFEPADLYSHGSFRALRHLYRVTSSLDSMMVGESQILGQVKEASRWAEAERLSGSQLGVIFSEAFRVAKKIRRETEMGRHAVSMINLLHSAVSEHLEGMTAPTVALVGVGPMTGKLAGHLREKFTDAQLIIVNRTVSKAEELARRFNAEVMSLESFLANPPAIDVLFSATSSELPIVDRVAAARFVTARQEAAGSLVMIDFAIPRDIDPSVGDLPGVRCVDIPYFRGVADANRRERFKVVDAAERIIDESIGRAHRNYVQQQFRPVFASTLNESLAYARTSLDKLFKSKLAHLDSRDLALVDHWVQKLVHYTNQLPLTVLGEQADTARGDSTHMPGFGNIRTRPESRIDIDDPADRPITESRDGESQQHSVRNSANPQSPADE